MPNLLNLPLAIGLVALLGCVGPGAASQEGTPSVLMDLPMDQIWEGALGTLQDVQYEMDELDKINGRARSRLKVTSDALLHKRQHAERASFTIRGGTHRYQVHFRVERYSRENDFRATEEDWVLGERRPELERDLAQRFHRRLGLAVP